MTPVAAGIAILLLVLVALGLGLVLRRRGPRVRTVAGDERVDPAELGAPSLGEVGTVVQFSTAYCTRCPGTQRLLTDLVRDRDGITFLHVDVTEDPRLATKYRLLQTPTVLFVDAAGRPRTRVSGTVTRPALVHELNALTALTGGTA